jgi:tripartite-type tricarboxylate transporter receptor subunit TctC
LMLVQPAAKAQDPAASFPNKPIRFVVGAGAGGGTDIQARLLAGYLTKAVGQPVIVENKPGASTMIAAQTVASATPDGHTLFVGGSAAMVFLPIVQAKMPYDPSADLTPVTTLGTYPLVIAVKSELSARSLGDLVKLAKEKPGTLNYGSAAVSFQVPMEYFNQRAGIKLTHVPYKGSGPSVQGMLAGDIEVLAVDMAPAVGLLKSGKARALAVTSAKRAPELPDVPTVAETGVVPDFDFSLMSIVVAPGRTPPSVVRKLQQEIAKVLASSEVRERLLNLGVDPGGLTPEATAARINREIALYRPIAQAAGLIEKK